MSSPSSSPYHSIYTAEYVGGGPVNHIAFVLVAPSSTSPSNPPAASTPTTCTAYDVTGTVLAGMTFRIRAAHPWPKSDPEHIPGSLQRVGCIADEDLERWESVCRGVEPPSEWRED